MSKEMITYISGMIAAYLTVLVLAYLFTLDEPPDPPKPVKPIRAYVAWLPKKQEEVKNS